MRSCAFAVARLEVVPALYTYSHVFFAAVHVHGRATPDARERIPTVPHARTTPHALERVPTTIVLPEFELRWRSFGLLLTETHSQPQEPDP
jgi:hypothetical protein